MHSDISSTQGMQIPIDLEMHLQMRPRIYHTGRRIKPADILYICRLYAPPCDKCVDASADAYADSSNGISASTSADASANVAVDQSEEGPADASADLSADASADVSVDVSHVRILYMIYHICMYLRISLVLVCLAGYLCALRQ